MQFRQLILRFKLMSEINPYSLLLSFSGNHGAPGSFGISAPPAQQPGIKGADGQQGYHGTFGDPSCSVDVELEMLGSPPNQLIINTSLSPLPQSLPFLPSSSLLLLANGGTGGSGGYGGDGGEGGRGPSGLDANERRVGTNGGNGGDGGDGAQGGRGGNGGEGGKVCIKVKKDDLDLLMFVGKVECKGGKGGEGGKGGRAGEGGKGGVGGAGFSWIKNVFSQKRTIKNYYKNPGGFAGMNGRMGRNGKDGKDGKDGKEGFVKFVIINKGMMENYGNRYNVIVKDFKIKFSEDKVFEPGDTLVISHILFYNESDMDTPFNRKLFPFIEETKFLSYELDENAFIPMIKGKSEYLFEGCLKAKIKKEDTVALNTAYIEYSEIIVSCLVSSVNKKFDKSFVRSIPIHYPIMMSSVAIVRSITIHEMSPFCVEIKNFSSKDYGTCYRKIELCIENEDPESIVNIEFMDEHEQIYSLYDSPRFPIDLLKCYSSIPFFGTFHFKETSTVFSKSLIRCGLYLENNEGCMELIQSHNFELILQDEFHYDPKADFLLIVNSNIEKKELESWKLFARFFGNDIMVWNTSIYQSFNYNLMLNKKFSLGENLKDKVVIILDDIYKKDENHSNILDIINPREIFHAAKQLGISTYIKANESSLLTYMLPLDELDVKRFSSYNDFLLEKRRRSKAQSELFPNKKLLSIKDYIFHTINDNLLTGPNQTELDENEYEKITVIKNFWWRYVPTLTDFHKEIKIIYKSLKFHFPNKVFYFFYDLRIIKMKTSCPLKSKWVLGDIEIRRGIDFDFTKGSIMTARKIGQNIENFDFFGMLKLLPFEKKIDWLMENYDKNENCELLFQTIFSDLVEELCVYSRIKKINGEGFQSKNLKMIMVFFHSFYNESFLIFIKQHEFLTKRYIITLVNYIFLLEKLVSFFDYLQYNNNKRILRNCLKKKLDRIISNFFKSEKKSIYKEVSHLKKKCINDNFVSIASKILNPYHKYIKMNNSWSSNYEKFMFDFKDIPLQQENKFFPKTKIGQYEFFDSNNVLDSNLRLGCLYEIRKKCKFEMEEEDHD